MSPTASVGGLRSQDSSRRGIPLNLNERSDLIARYAAGYDEVLDSLSNATDADLDRDPPDGGWSPRKIIHHLADSEMTSAIRLRRLLAEDSPMIQGYDEEEFARRLHYERPIETSLQALKASRDSTVSLLECLSDEEWQRAGSHSESGAYSVQDWLRIYANHAHDHANQIRKARG